MLNKKPVIGLAGGVGSGKSLIGRQFVELGCVLFNADTVAKDQYKKAEIKQQLVSWWGEDVIRPDGGVDLKKVGALVFGDQAERERLEGLIHPLVDAERKIFIERANKDEQVKGIVLDVPLLFEVGVDRQCDAVVFVDTALETRIERVISSRGWDREELIKREKNQFALDMKRQAADYIVDNNSSVSESFAQVENVFKQILSQPPEQTPEQCN